MVNDITKLLKDTLEAASKLNRQIDDVLASKNEPKNEERVDYASQIQLLDPNLFTKSKNKIQDILNGIEHLNTISSGRKNYKKSKSDLEDSPQFNLADLIQKTNTSGLLSKEELEKFIS